MKKITPIGGKTQKVYVETGDVFETEAGCAKVTDAQEFAGMIVVYYTLDGEIQYPIQNDIFVGWIAKSVKQIKD